MEEMTNHITLTTLDNKSVKVFIDFIEISETRRRTSFTEFVIDDRVSLRVKETRKEIQKLILEAQS